METATPPPEADLIRIAREALGLKASAAVRRMAEMSPPDAVITAAYWLEVEKGTGSRRGERGVPARASAATLAHMAYAVGVTPEELTSAGRTDAAEILTEIVRQRSKSAAPELPHYSNPALERIRNMEDLDEPGETAIRRALIGLATLMKAQKEQGDRPVA
jgi:transcriptional regulator with XRE-family HTH domain